MGKLYFITGHEQQTRKDVCCAILKWSQDMQMQPLQPWPAEESTAQSAAATTAPNFYLYNYLAHGTREELAQLTETYGEEVVEPIYLRSESDTEAKLLEMGIYQSYALQPDYYKSLQEIVETVFLGYQKTSYDFKAALTEAQVSQESSQANGGEPAQPAKKPRRISRKLLLRGGALLAWIVAVCLVTVLIHNAVNSNPQPTGELIPVTAGSNTQPPTTTPIMLSPSEIDRTDETRFAQPISYTDLDIFSEIQTDRYASVTGVLYDSGDVCYIPGPTSRYEKSQDRQITILLTRDLTLWQIDKTGTRIVYRNVSQFSLAGNGSRVYFVSGELLYDYDTQTGLMTFRNAPKETVNSLVSSPSGAYCTYATTDKSVYLLKSAEGAGITQLPLTAQPSSLVALSDDGKWIYSYSPTLGCVRESTSGGNVTALSSAGDFISKLYFNADATELYYEYEGALYFCNSGGNKTKLLDVTETGWQLFLAQSADVYTRKNLYVQNLYFYNDSLTSTFLCVGNTVYRLELFVEGTTARLNTYGADAIWIGENCLIMESDSQFIYCGMDENGYIITHVLLMQVSLNLETVVNFSSGVLSYLDAENQLHCYSLTEERELATLDFSNISGYAFSKDGTEIFYMQSNHMIQGYSIQNAAKMEIPDFSSVPVSDVETLRLQVYDGGVYLHDTTHPATFIYRISTEEPHVTYVGNIT